MPRRPRLVRHRAKTTCLCGKEDHEQRNRHDKDDDEKSISSSKTDSTSDSTIMEDDASFLELETEIDDDSSTYGDSEDMPAGVSGAISALTAPAIGIVKGTVGGSVNIVKNTRPAQAVMSTRPARYAAKAVKHGTEKVVTTLW